MRSAGWKPSRSREPVEEVEQIALADVLDAIGEPLEAINDALRAPRTSCCRHPLALTGDDLCLSPYPLLLAVSLTSRAL